MKTKNELIEEVLRLDSHVLVSPVYSRNVHVVCFGESERGGYLHKDPRLYEAAPQMARLIRDLIAQRDMAVEALEGVLGCRSHDEHGEFHGWRISAGASHGGGLTQRAVSADETLAKIKSGEWVG